MDNRDEHNSTDEWKVTAHGWTRVFGMVLSCTGPVTMAAGLGFILTGVSDPSANWTVIGGNFFVMGLAQILAALAFRGAASMLAASLEEEQDPQHHEPRRGGRCVVQETRGEHGESQ